MLRIWKRSRERRARRLEDNGYDRFGLLYTNSSEFLVFLARLVDV